MAEFFSDVSREIERVFLWRELQKTFRENFNLFGVQIQLDSYEDSQDAPTRLVLADEPFEDEDTLEVWGDLTAGSQLISRAVILYVDRAGRETFKYALTPDSIIQYSQDPTPLDKDDLVELRDDIRDAVWSKDKSLKCAESLISFN